ncbi:50S ribosomal protein L23p [Candidatus Mancarchaeum acidiphilum]|uniref:Large ribosomal subunit protein uL23 n=1 Tax=Candidatus Mancarchaeum acidiphilum TaxID=1920749 RepID=A0A218NP34_9ARCH|nr:50S ribosomal protein L23 [Candidatus Mancarchaeum acidiphilum]ASI14238.1 50S ribosomal protein L23p [Candidatus Mancarchaeum acidiphilum]
MSILMYPIGTEKAITEISKDNMITYVVDLDSTKYEIKKEFEKQFNVKVDKVRVINTPKNKKHAFIKLKKEFNASDVAMKLKLV